MNIVSYEVGAKKVRLVYTRKKMMKKLGGRRSCIRCMREYID